jgi:hypothetical protein
MPGKDFDRQEKGKPILAKTLNDPIAEIERASKLAVASGLTLQSGPQGPAIASQEVRSIVAKITSGSGAGPYAWTEQMAGSTAGSWADAYLSGTTSADPAFNLAGSVSLSLPLTVTMTRDDSGVWWFLAGSC